ncbi:MAG: histone deacetylase, partial [Candidatus Aminicenantales bacterium]
MVSLKDILARWRLRKFTLKFVYSEKYWMVNLNQHVFPVEKYRLLYERLIRLGAKKRNFLFPQPASDEDLFLVHTAKYLNKLRTNSLSQSEILTMELPYSLQLLEFALYQVGGTVLAAETALKEGLAVHIGGGFHHAFSDHGEGFCIVNDVAVALEKMKQEGKIQKWMV